MAMKLCTICGARNYVRDIWSGGDKYCDHFYRQTMVSERLVQEMKLLLTSYQPEEIVAAARQICGGSQV